jgi:methionine-S-sulfoxide reductase
VIRTRSGYSGGTTENPTYEHIGDHSETVQIDYDPTRISYEELLEIFWNSHNPAAEPWSKQYRSAIFYHNEEQKRLALESKAREEARIEQPIHTAIIPASEFYLAEDYHQKFYLQLQSNLMAEFHAMYPDFSDFINSTAAARVNGYIRGYGAAEALQTDLNNLGLSPDGSEKLLEIHTRARNRQLE